MSELNFTTTFSVGQSPAEVFNAINNVRGWWSEEVEGNTTNLYDEWNYHYQDVHRCQMKIVELIPDKRIVWLVLDNYFSFTKDQREWKGNKLIFDITREGAQTKVRFTQEGLVPTYECYDICEGAWKTYIGTSLHSLITTGKGQPNGTEKPQTHHEKQLAESFTTTFFVNQKPAEVYAAINRVSDWWQGEIKGSSQNLTDEFAYRMLDVHYSKQQVIELVPNKKIVWQVTESNLGSFQNKAEWTGTQLVFEIKEINGKTQVRFTHVGLNPKFQCYGDCSGAWEMLIQQSLVSLITTGKGKDVF